MTTTRLRLLALLAAALVTLTACTPSGKAQTARPHWTAGYGQRWQIQLGGSIDESMNVTYYDLDPVTTTQETVHAIASSKHRMICHLNIDAIDVVTPDAAMLPAKVKGKAAGDRLQWLNIREWSAVGPVVRNALDLCKTKGFQGVDADMADGYAYDTGFDLTAADQIAYDRNVVSMAQGMGLAIAVRTTPALVAALEPDTDFAVIAGCAEAGTCTEYRAYAQHNKPVLDVETAAAPTAFCPSTVYLRFAVVGKPDGLSSPAITTC
ncbi:MAG TPA: endo alpha-1,4 polygalactosaminidase [Micromonosporaceae bacterium]|jgi:hypothetical protein